MLHHPTPGTDPDVIWLGGGGKRLDGCSHFAKAYALCQVCSQEISGQSLQMLFQGWDKSSMPPQPEDPPLLLQLCLTRCQQNSLCSFCHVPLPLPATRMWRNCSYATSMRPGGISKSPCAFGSLGKACSGSPQPCGLINNTRWEPKGLGIVSLLHSPLAAPRLF